MSGKMRDDEHTMLEVATVGGTVFKLQQLRAGSTIEKVKEKLSKPMAKYESGNTDASNLVLVGSMGELRDNRMTVREAGLMDGRVTVMTSAQYATREFQKPHPGLAKGPSASPSSRPPLRSALKKPHPTPTNAPLTVTIESNLRSSPFVLTDISTRDTFSTILSRLSTEVDIPPQRLAIVVDNKKMDPRMTLANASIRSGSTCLLVEEESIEPVGVASAERRGDTVDLILENIRGEREAITISMSDFVVKLHKSAELTWGLPPANVGAFYRGEMLEPSHTIGGCGLIDGCVVRMLLKAKSSQVCNACGMPSSTRFCSATGEPHNKATTAESPRRKVSIAEEDANLPIPPAADGRITISILSKVDNKEYRLPSLKPQAVTVKSIKILLAKNTGLPLSEQVLKTQEGIVLKDNYSLAQAGIENAETLILATRVPMVGATLNETGLSQYPAMSPPAAMSVARADMHDRSSSPGHHSFSDAPPDLYYRDDIPPSHDAIPGAKPPPTASLLSFGNHYEPSPHYPIPPPSPRSQMHDASLPPPPPPPPLPLHPPPPHEDEFMYMSRPQPRGVSPDVEELIYASSAYKNRGGFRSNDPRVSPLPRRDRSQERLPPQDSRRQEDDDRLKQQITQIQEVADGVTQALKEQKEAMDSHSKALEESARMQMEQVKEERQALEEEKIKVQAEREEREARERRERENDRRHRESFSMESRETRGSESMIRPHNRAEKIGSTVYKGAVPSVTSARHVPQTPQPRLQFGPLTPILPDGFHTDTVQEYRPTVAAPGRPIADPVWSPQTGIRTVTTTVVTNEREERERVDYEEKIKRQREREEEEERKRKRDLEAEKEREREQEKEREREEERERTRNERIADRSKSRERMRELFERERERDRTRERELMSFRQTHSPRPGLVHSLLPESRPYGEQFSSGPMDLYKPSSVSPPRVAPPRVVTTEEADYYRSTANVNTLTEEELKTERRMEEARRAERRRRDRDRRSAKQDLTPSELDYYHSIRTH